MKKVVIILIIALITTFVYLLIKKIRGGREISLFKMTKQPKTLAFEEYVISNKSEFIDGVRNISEELELVSPDHLMIVFYKEAGMNPQAYNDTTGATGIIQFMPSTAKWLGTTTSQLYKMTNVQQLEYVKKYYMSIKKMTGKPLRTVEDLYMGAFFPKAIGKPDDYVLQTDTLSAHTIAVQNPAINKWPKDEQITVGEFKKYVRAHLGASILERL